MPTHKLLALSVGEPAGIGPDLVIQLAQSNALNGLVCFADPELLKTRAAALELPITIELYDAKKTPAKNHICVQPIKLAQTTVAGQLNTQNAKYVLQCLKQAAQACHQGEFAALVTGPVHKGVINDAGIAFTGHTEFLADLLGGHPVMLLAADKLRVALATTHLPLSKVSAAINGQQLEKTLRTLQQDLKRLFAIPNPNILVCGLNPHAGEGGHLGDEEIRVIGPVCEALRQQGMRIIGPLPADSLFTPANLQHADAVLAMYHDQGLPVLKYAGFGHAVNITLGIPIIRTSVDHGTALDLAGTGKASPDSLNAAIELARSLAANQCV